MNLEISSDNLQNRTSGGLRTNLRLQSVPHHLCLLQVRTRGDQMPPVQVTIGYLMTRSPSAKNLAFRENYGRQGPERNRLLERESEELEKLTRKLQKLLNKD